MARLDVVDAVVGADEETLVPVVKSTVKISFPVSLLDLSEVTSAELERAERELGKLLINKIVTAHQEIKREG